MKNKIKFKKPYIIAPDGWVFLKSTGPGPFVTRAKFRTTDGLVAVWNSRHHRKHHFRLDKSLGSTLWAPGAIGWWVGILFAIGAALFAVGSVPIYFKAVGVFNNNLTYFFGSLFFTSAGILQYLETVNAPHKMGGRAREKFRILTFEPKRIDWWVVSVQSLGTLFFNLSTFTAMMALTTGQIKVFVWSPDLYGSICFLISSYLAYSEAGHAFFSFKIRNMPWWISFINLLGSVAFGISAIASFIPDSTSQPIYPVISIFGTFIGAVCFFVAAVLLLPERTMKWTLRK